MKPFCDLAGGAAPVAAELAAASGQAASGKTAKAGLGPPRNPFLNVSQGRTSFFSLPTLIIKFIP